MKTHAPSLLKRKHISLIQTRTELGSLPAFPFACCFLLNQEGGGAGRGEGVQGGAMVELPWSWECGHRLGAAQVPVLRTQDWRRASEGLGSSESSGCCVTSGSLLWSLTSGQKGPCAFCRRVFRLQPRLVLGQSDPQPVRIAKRKLRLNSFPVKILVKS